jgi:membrane-associated HD superfamily phosphohydrolase
MDSPRPSARFFSRQTILPILVLVCTSILVYLALIQSWSLRETSLPLAVGDVASQDLSAPRNIQYVSNVLTATARDDAERMVAPVYIPPDPAIARTQIANLSNILQSISLIRIDGSTSLEDKKTALAAVPGLFLQPDSVNFFLSLSDIRWTLVRSETYNVLGQTLRNPVRTEDLEAVRQGLASLVSFSLTEREAELAVEIVSPLIVANSFYSPEQIGRAHV